MFYVLTTIKDADCSAFIERLA